MATWMLPAACIIWILGILAGMGQLLRYSNSPGDLEYPPRRWPTGSAIPHEAGRATLLMMAHPHCPCTRSSLHELALIVRQCRERMHAHVLFVRHKDAPDDWDESDLRDIASAIPGVEIHTDVEGVEARRFQTETSGTVVLYDPDGNLVFCGGITGARGHEGENEGRGAVIAMLSGERNATPRTLVFGCGLFDPPDGCGACIDPDSEKSK